MKEDLWITYKNGKRRRACYKICPVCKFSFLDRISHGCRVFCSLKCKNKSQEKTKFEGQCAWCKNSFTRLKSHLKSKNGINFCSKQCKDRAARLDGIKEIHPDHYGTANKYRYLFKDEELFCRRCGYKEFIVGIDIHHIDGNRRNNDKKNLKPLCSPCHRAFHKGYWKLKDLRG